MKLSKATGGLLSLAFWLIIWYLAAYKVGQDLILPGPAVVLRTLGDLASEKDFWISAFMTLLRIFSGFLAGVIIGTILAVLTCASRGADIIFSPFIRTVRAVPVASFIILVLLWVGRAFVPALVSALIVVPVVWQAVSTAIGETDKNLLEMAGAYKFGFWKTVKYVYIPSVLPSWSGAVVTAMGLAWKSGVAAEVLCLPKEAIGTQLYYSKIYLETPSLFAWTLVVIVLSFLLEYGFKLLSRRGVK